MNEPTNAARINRLLDRVVELRILQRAHPGVRLFDEALRNAIALLRRFNPAMQTVNRCNLRADCRVEAVYDQAEMSGRINHLREEIDRLKKVETDNAKLESRIFELEEKLEDVENDPPIDEPRRPEDMRAQHGLDMAAGLQRGGGS